MFHLPSLPKISAGKTACSQTEKTGVNIVRILPHKCIRIRTPKPDTLGIQKKNLAFVYPHARVQSHQKRERERGRETVRAEHTFVRARASILGLGALSD